MLKSSVFAMFSLAALAHPANAEEVPVRILDENPSAIFDEPLNRNFNIISIECNETVKGSNETAHGLYLAYYKPVYTMPADTEYNLEPSLADDLMKAETQERQRESMEYHLKHNADPENWVGVTLEQKTYHFAVAPDGQTVSLNNPEENAELLKKFLNGEWSADGYPRTGGAQFVDMARVQCGLGL